MRLGDDRVHKAKAQQLRRDYKAIAFREDFVLRLFGLVSQLVVLGDEISETEVVAKYLRILTPQFDRLTLAIETMFDLGDLTIEDMTQCLKAVKDHADARDKVQAGGAASDQLLPTHDESVARIRGREAGEGSSAPHGGGRVGRSRGRGRSKRGGGGGGRSRTRRIAKDHCLNCGDSGHWSRDCMQPRRECTLLA